MLHGNPEMASPKNDHFRRECNMFGVPSCYGDCWFADDNAYELRGS